MEPEVTVNWTSADTYIYVCYEIDHFHHTVKYTPSITCVLLCIFLVFLSVIAICGNLLVIISIIYFKQLHTPTNYLIVSLAVADLLVGAIVCPFNLIFSPSSCLYYDNVFCKVRNCFDITLTQCSILNLCCISIDRHYAVCQPLTYRTKISHHVAVIMILVIWGVSALTGIGSIIGELKLETCKESCLLFILILSLSTFYLQVIIMICIFCIYLRIFLVAQRQARSIQGTTCQSTKSGVTISKMERKATKTLTIVLGVFLICYLPLFLFIFIGPPGNNSVSVPVTEALNWLSLSNSMLNPFIYAFFYSWFRSAFRMIISGKIFQGDFTNSQLH